MAREPAPRRTMADLLRDQQRAVEVDVARTDAGEDVGQADVVRGRGGGDKDVDESAGISAGENASGKASERARGDTGKPVGAGGGSDAGATARTAAVAAASDGGGSGAGVAAGNTAGDGGGDRAGVVAGVAASSGDGSRARTADEREQGRDRRRRVGRPTGPERVRLSVRILSRNDELLTTAVERTGKSPQYIVDEALERWFRSIGL